MKIDKELLRKFATGECTEEEAEAAQAYFDEHPGELDNYFPLDDWLSDNKENLDHAASERILQQVRSAYEPEKSASITKMLLRYAVAASLIGVTIFAGVKLLVKPGKKSQEITFITTHKADSVQTLKTVENRTNEVIKVTLSDSSLVTIYPGSVLSYLPGFEKDKRELHLTGKGLFKVWKDKSRPFTVYTQGIATTALGTLFMVSGLKGRSVSVALIEGSIKVWPQHSDKQDAVILVPGDKLVVNSQKFNGYTLEKRNKAKKTHARGETTVIKDTVETGMAFKNHTLKEVFQKIEKRFEITIVYEAIPGIENESFTGTFLEDDNLEFICNTICNLHGLQYRKDGNVVTISKE